MFDRALAGRSSQSSLLQVRRMISWAFARGSTKRGSLRETCSATVGARAAGCGYDAPRSKH